MTDSKPWLWLLAAAALTVMVFSLADDDVRPTTTIPPNMGGRSASVVDNQLRDLGFTNILYATERGNSATARPEWTVTSIDGAGRPVALDSWITVRVR